MTFNLVIHSFSSNILLGLFLKAFFKNMNWLKITTIIITYFFLRNINGAGLTST